MTKLKLVWAWVKSHSSLVLGGLVSLLLAIITLGAYNRKVGRLKDALKVEEAMREVAALEARRDAAVATEAQLADKDARRAAKDSDLDAKIAEAKRQAVAASEAVEGRTNEEVAARFNELYRR
jgi:predicted Holliday junction resolvase-like endonuclease